MSFADLLINTCTTRRFTEGAADDYGNPVKTWANNLVDQPCRWSYPKNTEVKIGAEVVIVDLQLFMNDVDVIVQDRIVLNTETYEVLSVLDRQDGVGDHHKELLLRLVR